MGTSGKAAHGALHSALLVAFMTVALLAGSSCGHRVLSQVPPLPTLGQPLTVTVENTLQVIGTVTLTSSSFPGLPPFSISVPVLPGQTLPIPVPILTILESITFTVSGQLYVLPQNLLQQILAGVSITLSACVDLQPGLGVFVALTGGNVSPTLTCLAPPNSSPPPPSPPPPSPSPPPPTPSPPPPSPSPPPPTRSPPPPSPSPPPPTPSPPPPSPPPPPPTPSPPPPSPPPPPPTPSPPPPSPSPPPPTRSPPPPSPSPPPPTPSPPPPSPPPPPPTPSPPPPSPPPPPPTPSPPPPSPSPPPPTPSPPPPSRSSPPPPSPPATSPPPPPHPSSPPPPPPRSSPPPPPPASGFIELNVTNLLLLNINVTLAVTVNGNTSVLSFVINSEESLLITLQVDIQIESITITIGLEVYNLTSPVLRAIGNVLSPNGVGQVQVSTCPSPSADILVKAAASVALLRTAVGVCVAA